MVRLLARFLIFPANLAFVWLLHKIKSLFLQKETMAQHNILGKEGENAAADYLVRNGYSIRHRNWRAGRKELDIVADNGEELIVVEVKSRKDTEYARPEDAVNATKIRRIVSATDKYINQYQLDMPVRFDIITVTGTKGHFAIEHIENAFYSPIW